LKLFERFFKRKLEDDDASRTLSTPEEIAEWLERRLERERRELDFDVEKSLNTMRELFNALMEKTEELERTEVEGAAKQNKIIEFNKNNMVKQVRSLIGNTKFPREHTYNELREFHTKTENNLRICLENSMKSYQYTRLLLPSSRQLIDLVKQIHALLEQIKTPLNSKEESISQLTKAKQLLQQLQEKHAELQAQEQAGREIAEKISRIEEELKTVQQEREELENSRAWKDYLNTAAEEEQVKNTLENLLKQLNLQITPIVKVLKRLEKQNKSQRRTLTEERRETLTQLLHTPQTAENTASLLKYLKELLTQDTLGIPPQKVDKTIAHINHLLESNRLEELQRTYRKTYLELEHIKKTLSESELTERWNLLERREREKTAALARLQTEKNQCERRIEQLKEEKAALVEEIQQIVSTISQGKTTCPHI
jgi:DNA repair exonuclease SbcCD ATPase subunit